TTDNRPPASTLQPLLPFRRRPPPTSTLFPYTTLFRSRTALHWPFDGGQRSPAPSRRSRGHIRRDRSRLPRHDRGGTGLLDRGPRSEEHTSELQSPYDLVCRLLLEKKKESMN